MKKMLLRRTLKRTPKKNKISLPSMVSAETCYIREVAQFLFYQISTLKQ